MLTAFSSHEKRASRLAATLECEHRSDYAGIGVLLQSSGHHGAKARFATEHQLVGFGGPFQREAISELQFTIKLVAETSSGESAAAAPAALCDFAR